MTPDDVAALGEDVPLLEGIRTTRAIRRLRPDPVPRELIAKICEAGTYAPSGGNRQPWIFVAVTEPERRAWVGDRYRAGFHRYIAPALEAAKDPSYPEAGRRNMKAALHLADHLLDVAGVRDCFDAVLSSEQARSCKPAPGIFQHALASAGCAANEAFFVGDSLFHDVGGANELGMTSVLIWHSDEREPPGDGPKPHHVIRRFPELLELLR